MTDVPYKMKVKIGENEIELVGDKKWVEEKLSEFKELIISQQLSEVRQKPIPASPVQNVSSTKMPETISQFYREKGEPRNHVDKVMLWAFWLTKVEQMDTYNITDILRCYDDARVKQPRNINDIMNKVNSDFLHIAPDKDSKKARRISSEGEGYIEAMGK